MSAIYAPRERITKAYLFLAAKNPPTPAASTASTVMIASAMLSIKVAGRNPHTNLLC